MLIVENLARSFGVTKAVDDLSFSVQPGEIFALLGPNGAGKTTTIRMILGMIKPDKGKITFNGHPVAFGDVEYKADIGYVPETSHLYENLRGEEYIKFIGNLYHLDPDRVMQTATQMMALLELNPNGSQIIREYSKGMRQKLMIITAILHNPSMIILDEPFSGLDANTVSVLKEFLRAETRHGKAVVFCSHVLDVVERLVDCMLVMKNGHALAKGTPSEIMKQANAQTLDQAFSFLTGAKNITERADQNARIINSQSDRAANE
ncbi:MAG: ABC transporter ATP-binding protein [Desulfobacteraceae bacterium]|nr:ABC transporter ATP-binding protein [Desulfobacteraceae bacterium]